MKTKLTTFNIKGNKNICWEDVKHVRGIKEEELIWDEFESLFRRKYISEKCYDGKAKDLYELRMGSMTDEEYTPYL